MRPGHYKDIQGHSMSLASLICQNLVILLYFLKNSKLEFFDLVVGSNIFEGKKWFGLGLFVILVVGTCSNSKMICSPKSWKILWIQSLSLVFWFQGTWLYALPILKTNEFIKIKNK